MAEEKEDDLDNGGSHAPSAKAQAKNGKRDKNQRAASLKDYESDDVDDRGRKIKKVDFGDQSELPRVMFKYHKGSVKEAVPMKRIIAEEFELRGIGKIVKGTAPDRPTIEDAKKTAAEIRAEKEAATR